MKNYEKIVTDMANFFEAALEEGMNCGYNGPYDPKDKDQDQFDRGQYNAYKKAYKHLRKLCSDEGIDVNPEDDDDEDEDDPLCSLEEFLRQIIDLANDDK